MNPGYDSLVWWIGFAEDIDDPKQSGRIKVRIPTEHSDKVLSDDLPWATPLVPVTQSATQGIGSTPVGIQLGTPLMGFFADGKQKSKPIIWGSWSIVPEDDDSKHSVTSIARGKGPVQKEYLEELGERKSAYAAQYPYNKVTTTRSGHTIEIDDTPKAERIHIYHKSGSYVEMFPDGSIVNKANKDSVSIAIGDVVHTSAKGDVQIFANEGGLQLQSSLDLNIISDSKITLDAPVVSLNG